MTERSTDHQVDCHDFDDAIAELALEILEPAERDAMLHHASGCDRCRAELQVFAATADRITLIAPEAEPPVGFEQRAVQVMPGHRWARPALLAAAAALVLFVVGLAIGRATGSHDTGSTSAALAFRQGPLVDAAGARHGSVSLTDDGGVVLTMSLRSLDAGVYHCVVERSDGTIAQVAAWPVGATGAGVWAVAVDGRLEDIRNVSVTEDDGTNVATAHLG